jgi:uncharacterized membrane protein YbhN (UPF0104 family)
VTETGGPADTLDAPPIILSTQEVQEVSLARRFLRLETLGSLALVFALLGIFWFRSGADLSQVTSTIRHANFLLLGCAALVYYSSFLLRAERWKLLLGNAGMLLRFWSALRAIVISWFANCIVPAKIGDIYRGYLARRDYSLPGFRAMGTIVTERVMDLLVLVGMLFAASALLAPRLINSPHRALILAALAGAGALGVLLVALLVGLRFTGGRVSRLLPARVGPLLSGLRGGLTESVGKLPLLLGLTAGVWLLESARLYLVLAALGVVQSPLVVVLLALGAAFITIIPLTPAGAGFVEIFISTVLTSFGTHIHTSQAVSVTLLDRSISYYSLIIVGLITFILAGHPRAARVSPVHG